VSDLCEGWAHIKCIGVSPEAHGFHSGMKGLPWFCPNCIAEVRSLKTAMSELTDDNKALFAQAKESEEKIKSLQFLIAKLSEDIKFLTQGTVTPDTVSRPMEHQPHHIPVHQNPFEGLGTDPLPSDSEPEPVLSVQQLPQLTTPSSRSLIGLPTSLGMLCLPLALLIYKPPINQLILLPYKL